MMGPDAILVFWILRIDSFRIDWFDPLAVQGTPVQESSLVPQFESINFLVLSLLYVQLSHPYMTTGKTIALTRWTFVVKVMSLLLNMLSRLVITFLPRSKHLLISWLQSPSAAMKLKDAYSLEGKLWPTLVAYSKAETLLCQQRSI